MRRLLVLVGENGQVTHLHNNEQETLVCDLSLLVERARGDHLTNPCLQLVVDFLSPPQSEQQHTRAGGRRRLTRRWSGILEARRCISTMLSDCRSLIASLNIL